MRNALLASFFFGSCATAAQASDVPATPVSLPSLLDEPSLALASLDALFNQAILRDRSIDPTIRQLAAYAQDKSHSPRFRAQAWHAVSHLHWRIGRLEEASTAIDVGLAIEESPGLLLHRGRLHEAAGNLEEAAKDFTRALAGLNSPQEREVLQLRLVFLSTDPKSVDTLVEFARGRDRSFRNRTAIALAILGHPEKALSLFEAFGDETQQRRHHMRRAQWALQAKRAALAQEAAWNALHGDALSRDRRYVLALLVEAHELDGSWDRLLTKLAGRNDLGADGITVRIQVLERTRRLDDAIALLSSLDADELTPESQRLLLRMYGEAGRGEEMVARLRAFMAEQPTVLAWPRGLSEYLLERGRRDDAAAAWAPHLAAISTPGQLLAAAEALSQLAFYDLAEQVADRCARQHPEHLTAARNLQFNISLRRGQTDHALAILDALERELPEFSNELLAVAGNFERMKLPARAIAVWERLARRPNGLGPEEQMRLAWLYDATGRREESFALWKSLWSDNATPARLRLVEDRLLTMGAEMGKLADLAIEIEERLYCGEATPRESALLVRLYTQVQDPTSAIEVIREYFSQQPDSLETRITSLEEQAKIYQTLNRGAAFERVTLELIELNPEKSVEYLQALVLKEVDAGRQADVKKLEARLSQLRAKDASADEGFAAGVMQLIGRTDEAIAAYRRALALRPGDSENYLLIAELLTKARRTPEAVAMLQYFAEHGADDNGFVIAVDGLINQNLPATSPVIRWAQRRVLERITRKDDQFYLYDLSAELGEEMKNRPIYLASLEASIVDAGPRRSTVLRELVAATNDSPQNVRAQQTDLARNLVYSRRLIALGEEMPPDVYLNLGRTLLRLGKPTEALSVFQAGVERSGDSNLLEKAADRFEAEGYDAQAKLLYGKALAAMGDNPLLRLKLARLQFRDGERSESVQHLVEALERLATEQLVEVELASAQSGARSADDTFSFAFRRYAGALRRELLLAVPREDSHALVSRLAQTFDATLQLTAPRIQERSQPRAAFFPRLRATAELTRTVALQTGHYDAAEHLDRELLSRFADDESLVSSILAAHAAFGRRAAALRLAETPGMPSRHRARLLAEMPLNIAESDLTQLIQHAVRNGDYALATSLACAFGQPSLATPIYLQWASKPERADSDSSRGFIRRPIAVVALNDAHIRLDAARFKQLCQQLLSLPDAGRILASLLHSGGSNLLAKIETALGKPIATSEQLAAALVSLPAQQRHMIDYGFLNARVSHQTWFELLTSTLPVPPAPASFSWINGHAALGALRTPLNPTQSQALVTAFARRYEGVKQRDSEVRTRIAQNDLRALGELKDIHVSNLPIVDQARRLAETALGADSGIDARQLAAVRNVYRSDLSGEEVLARLIAAAPAKSTTRAHAELLRAVPNTQILLGRQPMPKILAPALDRLRSNGASLQLLLAISAIATLDAEPRAQDYVDLAREAADRVGDNPLSLEIVAEFCRAAGLLSRERELLDRLVQTQPDNARARTRLAQLWQRNDHPEEANAHASSASGSGQAGALGGEPDVLRSFLFERTAELRRTVKRLTQAKSAADEATALRHLVQLVRTDSTPGNEGLFPQFSLGDRPDGRWAGMVDQHPLNEGDTPQTLAAVLQAASRRAAFGPAVRGLLQALPPERTDLDDACELPPQFAAALAHAGQLEAEFARLDELVRRDAAGAKEITLWLELACLLPRDRAREVLARTGPALNAAGSVPHYTQVQLARLLATAGEQTRAVNGYAIALAATVAADEFSRGSGSQLFSARGIVRDAAQWLDADALATLIRHCTNLIPAHPDGANSRERTEFFVDVAALALERGLSTAAIPAFDMAALGNSPRQLVRASEVALRCGRLETALQGLRSLLAPPAHQGPSDMESIFRSSRFDRVYGVGVTLAKSRPEPHAFDADGTRVTTPLLRLFHHSEADMPNSAGWLQSVAAALPRWIDSGEVRSDEGLPVLALTALRQHELGNDTGAAESLRHAIRLAEKTATINGETATILAKVGIASGQSLPTGLAERLFNQPDVHPSVLSGLIERIAATRGAAEALELADAKLDVTRNDAFLQTLARLARSAGVQRKAAIFESLRANANESRAGATPVASE